MGMGSENFGAFQSTSAPIAAGTAKPTVALPGSVPPIASTPLAPGAYDVPQGQTPESWAINKLKLMSDLLALVTAGKTSDALALQATVDKLMGKTP